MNKSNPWPRLHSTVNALRLALADSPDILPFTLGGTIDKETMAAAESAGVPREYLNFCHVLDGASLNPSLQLFGLEEAKENQFYCDPIDGSPLPVSPERLFCIGVDGDTPIYLARAEGDIFGIPSPHLEWFDVQFLEHLAGGIVEFFLERLARPTAYARFASIDDDMLEFDEWLKLLHRAGISD